MSSFVRVFSLIGMFLSLSSSANAGSTFSEVRNVLFDRDARAESRQEQEELNVYRNGQLPHYEVNSANFVKNGMNVLLKRAKRTITETHDYYPRLEKPLHPNGICFTGEWVITEPSSYTGYFSQGKKGLFVGRASVAMTETEAGHKRGFGFAGKIFPTENAEENVETANFFTVDVLMGTKRPTFVGTALTNEPEIGFDLNAIWLGMKIANILKKADENPGFRPLYPIARTGLTPGQRAVVPRWMKITTDASTRIVAAKDFREELNIERYHGGKMRLVIHVSDSTKDSSAAGWRRLGYIELQESMVSYGCDRRLHFAHPKLKDPMD